MKKRYIDVPVEFFIKKDWNNNLIIDIESERIIADWAWIDYVKWQAEYKLKNDVDYEEFFKREKEIVKKWWMPICKVDFIIYWMISDLIEKIYLSNKINSNNIYLNNVWKYFAILSEPNEFFWIFEPIFEDTPELKEKLYIDWVKLKEYTPWSVSSISFWKTTEVIRFNIWIKNWEVIVNYNTNKTDSTYENMKYLKEIKEYINEIKTRRLNLIKNNEYTPLFENDTNNNQNWNKWETLIDWLTKEQLWYVFNWKKFVEIYESYAEISNED